MSTRVDLYRVFASILWSSLLGCGQENPFIGLDLVSGRTPFAAGCAPSDQAGTNLAGFEAEPYLAVDPANSEHLIGVWQQDRWSNGAANGLVTAASWDGGRTWKKSLAPFTLCSGGDAQNAGDYYRASDPWVVFAPDGTAYESGLAFTNSSTAAISAIVVSRSTDGGLTWSDPIALIRDTQPDFFNDKPTVTADPSNPQRVYAVWDRLTGVTNPNQALSTGPTWFTLSTNGTWEQARAIFDPGMDAQTISNQIFVLPSGYLINLFELVTSASSQNPVGTITALRSADQGTTWSAPVTVAAQQISGVLNPKTGIPVRGGGFVPSFGVDQSRSNLYVVWEDSRFSQGAQDGIVLSTSTDSGLTWSAPQAVNQSAAPAFCPSLAIGTNGEIAVIYYDLRFDNPRDSQHFLVTAWLVTSIDGGSTWTETQLTEPFDLEPAHVGNVYFLGDYQGLAATGGFFVPFFAVANPGGQPDPTDIYVKPL